MTTAADPAARNRPEGRMNGGRALAEMLRLSGAGPMFNSVAPTRPQLALRTPSPASGGGLGRGPAFAKEESP